MKKLLLLLLMLLSSCSDDSAIKRSPTSPVIVTVDDPYDMEEGQTCRITLTPITVPITFRICFEEGTATVYDFQTDSWCAPNGALDHWETITFDSMDDKRVIVVNVFDDEEYESTETMYLRIDGYTQEFLLYDNN